MPQLISMLPPIIDATTTMRTMTMTMYSTFSGLLRYLDVAEQNASAMGHFDAAKTTIPSTCRRKCSTTPTSNAV